MKNKNSLLILIIKPFILKIFFPNKERISQKKEKISLRIKISKNILFFITYTLLNIAASKDILIQRVIAFSCGSNTFFLKFDAASFRG